jgi:ABC-type Zn uptake system ZnuABC Zn-binding protein ZnuA
MKKILFPFIIIVSLFAGCTSTPTPAKGSGNKKIQVLAVESFIADMTKQVAGDRLQVDTLIPLGVDPHSFELTPADVTKIASTKVLVINGLGFESWLETTLKNSGSQAQVVDCSSGLTPRKLTAMEIDDGDHPEGDPHFWLDPTKAIHYVENIRDGLIKADPDGKDIYTANAKAYTAKLTDLDAWIAAEVAKIPANQRKLVTNHESFGYFADRYGFQVVGTIIPSITTGSDPSAQELADLVTRIKENKVKAVFLETGSNPQLAEQIAAEVKVKVVHDLYTHSLSQAGGDAPDYISMMRWNTTQVMEALQ